MIQIAVLCNLFMHGYECVDTWSHAVQFGKSSDFSLLISQAWRLMKTTWIQIASHGRQKVTSQWGMAPSLFLSRSLPTPLLLSHSHPSLPSSPSLLSDRLHHDRHISHSSSGKHHVDSGLCPEIKQYAVTERKKQTNKTQQHTYFHTCAPSHMVDLLWPQVKQDKQWRLKVASFPCGEPVYGTTIWARHCWQNSLRHIGTHNLHIWKILLTVVFFPSLLLFVKCHHQSVSAPGGVLKRICKAILPFGNDTLEIPWCSYLAAAPCY